MWNKIMEEYPDWKYALMKFDDALSRKISLGVIILTWNKWPDFKQAKLAVSQVIAQLYQAFKFGFLTVSFNFIRIER